MWGPLKKIGKGLLVGVKVGAMFDPHLAVVVGAIEAVEHSIKSGADKKATVMAVSDAVLDAELLDLSESDRAQLRAMRSEWIDLYVAIRNQTAALDVLVQQGKSAEATLMAFIAEKRKSSDGAEAK